MRDPGGASIRFDGRVVVVTGAARGIGRATALLLAERGAQLVLNNRAAASDPGTTGREPDAERGGDVPSTGRTARPAEALAAELRARGGHAVAETSDVAEPGSADAIVARALETYGRLDALVLNAGVLESRPVSLLEEAELMRLFAINTLSAFRLTRTALPSLRRSGSGRIVYTTSTAALYGGEGLAAYAMAKGALLGLMRAVAAEEAPFGVGANAICPTAVTRMTERFVENEREREALAPERVAPAIAWLASSACAFTGRVVTAGAGHFRSAHTRESGGLDLGDRTVIRIEDLAADADAILAPSGLVGHAGAGAHFAALLDEVRGRSLRRTDRAATARSVSRPSDGRDEEE